MGFRFGLELDFYSIKSLELLEYSAEKRTEQPFNETWADFAFLAACFSAGYGDITTAQSTAREIKASFPEYDPLRRFSWTSALDTPNSDEYFYRKFDTMAWFRNNNPSFKFETLFGDLFEFDIGRYEDFYK